MRRDDPQRLPTTCRCDIIASPRSGGSAMLGLNTDTPRGRNGDGHALGRRSAGVRGRRDAVCGLGASIGHDLDRPARRHRNLFAGVSAAGVAVALRRGHHPVGREIAVLPPGAIFGVVVGTRRMALVVAERVRRLAGDFRSAIADVLAASRAAGRTQSGDRPARVRRGDLRLPVPRRAWRHSLFPRPRLACRRSRRGGFGLCVRRFRERAPSAHRAGGQPGLSAVGIVARGARVRAFVVARRRGSGHDRRTDGDRARSGRAAVALRPGRICSLPLDRGSGSA